MPPNMEMDDHPPPEGVRPAITSDQGVTNNTSATDEGSETTSSRTKSPGRRVNFPADDALVTGYLEAPNPWEKGLNTTPDELVAAYKEACERHNIKPLTKVLQQLQGLVLFGVDREDCLSLKGEKLDLKHYDAMEEIFKRVRFKTIDVESTNLDDEGSVALFDMIEYYESTETLNISSNKNMSTRGWQACARMLKKTHCLEALDAHNTGLNEQFMALLCRTLRSGSYLTRLHLESCNLSGRACTVLMTALKLNSSLRELYLAENKLSSTDALQIGNLLRANTKLQLIDLRNNHIQDTGVAHIVDGLNDQSMGPGEGLQTLVLWSNQLTFNSSNHLSKALVSSKNLKALNIGCNNITNEGIFLLKDALMKNRTLQQLGLQATRITCEGAVALAEYIADNPCVQQIDMRENNIKVAGLLALSLSMKVNHSVTRLDLDKDPKKESKELQDQHQRLLLEIIEYCERNHQEAEQIRLTEEKRQKQLELEEPEERLSESVCRLLSLWDPAPSSPKGCGPWPVGGTPDEIKNAGCTPGRSHAHGSPLRTTPHEGSYIQHLNASDSQPSTPIIVLPEGGEPSTRPPVSIGLPRAALRSVNPSLLSPPAGCPSPPKSRFRVCKVVMDTSDTLLSSAGSTPMPSPVPSPGNTPLPSPGCTPLPSPGCTPLPSPTASPIGSPVSSPLRVMTPNSIPISVCSPLSSTKSIMKVGTHVSSNDINTKHLRQKPMFVVTTVSVPHVGLNKDYAVSVTASCTKDTAVVTTTSVSPSSLPSSLSAISNGICAPPSSPAGSEMPSVTSTPSDSFTRSLGSPSDLISLHSPVSTSVSTASSDPTPPTAFTFSEVDKAVTQPGWDAPPNTPAETTSSISDYSDPPSLTVTDDLGLSSRSLTSSSSSSGSLTVSGYKSSSPASVPWTPSPVESEAETKLSTRLSPTSESNTSAVSYPSAISVVSPSDASPSLDTPSLSKSDWPTPETPLYSPSAETVESSFSPANANNDDQSWNNSVNWNWTTKTSSASVVSGRFSVGMCGSDSMVSLDSGVATPGSELSTGSDRVKNTAAVVSAAGSTTKITPPGFLCLGSVAPPCSPIDSPLSLNCGTGMMAPPSSPMEPETGISDSLVLSSVNLQTANSKKVATSPICPVDGHGSEALSGSKNVQASWENKHETTDFDVKSVPGIKVSTPKSLPIERNVQPLSPNQSDKKQIVSPCAGVVSSAKSPTSQLRKVDEGIKSPDSAKGGVSPTHSGRTRQIRLAEPSCVLLFGGGIPKSNSPSKESSIDVPATPPTPPNISPKANNSQLQNIVMAELARSVATVEATCASLDKLLQESLTAELNSTNMKESEASIVPKLEDTEKRYNADKVSALRASSHCGDKAISNNSESHLVKTDDNNAPPFVKDSRHMSNLTTMTTQEKSSADSNSSAAVTRVSSIPFSDENGNVPASRRKSEMLLDDKLSSYEPVLQLVGIQQSRRHQLRKSFSEQDSKGLVRRKSTGSYPCPTSGRRKDRAAMVRQATLTLDALIEKQLVELNLSLRNTANAKECDSSEKAYQSLPCDFNTTPSIDRPKATTFDRLQPAHEGSELLAVEKQDQLKPDTVLTNLTDSCTTANIEQQTKNNAHCQQSESTVLCTKQLPRGSVTSSIVHSTGESDSDSCADRMLDTYKPSGLDTFKDTVLLSGRESYSSVLKRSPPSPTQKITQEDLPVVAPMACSSTKCASNHKDSVISRSAAIPCNTETIPHSASGQSRVISSVCVDGLAENCVVTSLTDTSRSEMLPKAKENLLQSECNVPSIYSVKSNTVSSLCNVVLKKDQTVPRANLESKVSDKTDSLVHTPTDAGTVSKTHPEKVSDETSLPAHFNHNDVASVSASVIRQRLVGNSVPADQTVVANTAFCTNGLLLDNKESFCSPPVTSPCGGNGLNLNLCFLSEELGSSQTRLDATDLNLSMSSQEATSPETLTT